MLPAGQRIAPYVIVRHLADGGTSEVYEVTDGSQTFALKILKELHRTNSALQARFLNEAVLLESLTLEGVVRAFGNGDFQGRPYFIMEYLPTALAHRLPGPLPPAAILPLVAALARMLAALHQRGFVHRDIKPHNILFTPHGQLRLVDFSHAKHPQDDNSVIPHSTETGTFLGTRDYAAPEQFINAKGVDGSADVYSLGLVLFEALAGQRPFAAPSAEDVVRQRLIQRAPRLSSFTGGLSPSLVNLTARMLDRVPRNRPTAQEVAEQLAALPLQPWRPWRRNVLQIAFLLVGALSLQPRRLTLDDFDRVLDRFPLRQAVAVLEATEEPQPTRQVYARQVQKRADLALAQGQLPTAARLYEEAHGLFLRGTTAAARQSQAASPYAKAPGWFQTQEDRRRQASCANKWGDVALHQGDSVHAGALYKASQQDQTVLSVRGTNRGDEHQLTFYRFGLLYIEQKDWAMAQDQLIRAKDTGPKPLWLSRIEERLAGLPGEPDALTTAQHALRHAELAVRAEPTSKKAQLVRLRALMRLGTLGNDPGQQDKALAGARALWLSDPENGQWAHELLEMLVEYIPHQPKRGDLILQATQVLREIDRQRQWLDDVHIKRWRVAIAALTRPREGVLGE